MCPFGWPFSDVSTRRRSRSPHAVNVHCSPSSEHFTHSTKSRILYWLTWQFICLSTLCVPSVYKPSVLCEQFLFSTDVDDFPRTRHLYTVDVPSLAPFAATAALHAKQVDYPTKLSKMQNVSNITLFVSENFGGDSTIINYLGFKGESTNVRMTT